MKYHPLFLISLLFFLLCPFPTGAQGKEKEKGADSAVITVKKGDLHRRLSTVGTFQARQKTLLGLQKVSGTVEKVWVEVGEKVKQGQKLLALDNSFFLLQVQEQQLALSAARNQLDLRHQGLATLKGEVEVVKTALQEAQLKYQRMKNLWKKPKGKTPSIPKGTYDQARFQYLASQARLQRAQSKIKEAQAAIKGAEIQVKRAEKNLQFARKRLAETILRAPYDGVITKRMVDPGEPVRETPISHLLEIREISRLELEFSLPQKYLHKVKKGTPVYFEVEGVKGEGPKPHPISLVYPTVNPKTRAFRCRVEIENSSSGQRGFLYIPGLLAKVAVKITVKEQVLVIPRSAAQKTGQGWKVQLKKGDQWVEKKIEVGVVSDWEIEVVRGLSEGEEIKK